MMKLVNAGPMRLMAAFILCALVLLPGRSFAAEFEMISYTAYASLHWLKEANVPEAKEFAKATGKETLLSTDSIKNYQELKSVNALSHEICYAAHNRYIEKNGYKNVMDIACGFSPRGIYMARRGIKFVGAEFEPIVVAGTGYIKKCLNAEQVKLATYEVTDATDRKSMMATADKMNGPICIVMDGLMMYLGRDAQADTLQNIKAILKKHGGAYITTDFSAREIVMASSKVVYGDTEDARAVFHASAKVYEDIADARFEQNFFSSSDEAKKFIEAQGLKVELLPLFDAPTKLYSAKNFNKEQMKRLDALEKDAFLWVITVK